MARDSKSIKVDIRKNDLKNDAMRRRLREAAFLLLLPLVVYLFACLASYNPQDPGWSHVSQSGITRNIGGAVGAWAADLSFYLIGYLAYAFPILLLVVGWTLLRENSDEGESSLEPTLRLVGGVAFFVGGTGLAYLQSRMATALPAGPGGVIGQVVGEMLKHGFGFLGASLFLLALFLVALTSASHAPVSRAPSAFVATTLLLRVIDSATRAPVPNAEVTAHGRRGITDGRGEVRVAYPDDGELRVRIRQIGFRYADRTFHRDASRTGEDTVVVALVRIGWALPQVVVRAERHCSESVEPSQAALTQASMELLRFGAEQFENFRRAYPFDFTLEQRTAAVAPAGSARPKAKVQVDTIASITWGDRYTPGKVVVEQGRDQYFVPLLFVSALADSAFWDLHCFVARGVESRDGRRLIRLDFAPTLDVRDPDWEGSAWLDSARSVLARVDFRLTNLRGLIGPQRFDGYTVFTTPTPYIARPDSTVASWITAVPGGPYGYVKRSGGSQSLVIRDVQYRGRKPPEAER